MAKKIKKGVRVETSGRGRTAKWSKHKGIVTRRRKNLVYVHWDKTFFEDEMKLNEVKILK